MSISMRPRLVGVIDLMDGVAVRAIGGRREAYQPIRSKLCDSSDPGRIAACYRERYFIEELYVADLDAIRGGAVNIGTIAGLTAGGFRVSVDVGLRSPSLAEELLGIGVESAVVGLETLPGPEAAAGLVERFGPERLSFSLDLADGVPLADAPAWGEPKWDAESPVRIARRVAELGFERVIVLDLRSVGMSRGPATGDLCRRIRRLMPKLEVWTGGGVRSTAEAHSLHLSGAWAVLVASALHDGTLDADWQEYV